MAIKDLTGGKVVKSPAPSRDAAFEVASIKEIDQLSLSRVDKGTPSLDLSNLLASGLWASGASDEPVTDSGYAQDAVAQHAVISHIAPIERYLADAVDGITALRKTLGVSTSPAQDPLIGQLEDYVDTYLADGEIHKLFPEREHDPATYFPYNVDEEGAFVTPDLRDSDDDSTVVKTLATASRATITEGSGDDIRTIIDSSPVHTAIFKASQYLVDDTLVVQRLRHGVVRIKRDRLVLLKKLRAELETVRAKTQAAHRELAVRNRTRLESLGDYHLAQQLVREDWAATETRFAERQAVLDAHQGLYYVRVRETPVSLSLPDPLALRPSLPGDLLPGCGVQDKDLPEELTPFMDAVLDVPMSAWAGLREQYQLLPGRKRLDDLYGQRKLRLDWRIGRGTRGGSSGRAAKLAGLRQQNLSLLQDLARRSQPPRVSLRDYQLRSRDLLSLEDLLTGPSHRLRGQAAELRDQLNQATHCLLERLRVLPPSIRLAWAEGAEEDRGFQVERPERWPRLDQAEALDFNAVRTLIEIVNWWFRQLHDQADGNSRSAMRNLVRACLLLAASDDPEDIMHGQLKTVPGRFRVGEAMRLTLNREAMPGTQLRLLDASDRLIGLLRVDDEDDQGAVASVTQVFDSAALLATGYRVTGYRLDAGALD